MLVVLAGLLLGGLGAPARASDMAIAGTLRIAAGATPATWSNLSVTAGAGTTVVGSVRVAAAAGGGECATDAQCGAGQVCSLGVCCNTACTGSCQSCRVPGSEGTCTTLAAGTVCRDEAGACDLPETCNGSSTSCPATNQFMPAGTVCRMAAGSCDLAEICTGTAAACPADTLRPAGTTCDGTTSCTGASPTCGTVPPPTAEGTCRLL